MPAAMGPANPDGCVEHPQNFRALLCQKCTEMEQARYLLKHEGFDPPTQNRADQVAEWQYEEKDEQNLCKCRWDLEQDLRCLQHRDDKMHNLELEAVANEQKLRGIAYDTTYRRVTRASQRTVNRRARNHTYRACRCGRDTIKPALMNNPAVTMCRSCEGIRVRPNQIPRKLRNRIERYPTRQWTHLEQDTGPEDLTIARLQNIPPNARRV